MTTTTIGAGSDTLTLGITEDAYQGDAQFTIGVDDQQVGGVLTATSPHSSTSSDTVNVLGNWAPGPHTVTVNFLNDAYDGTSDTDRNFYVDGATYNGVFVPRAAQTLYSSGPVSFGVTDTTSVSGSSLVVPAGTTTAAEGEQLAGVNVVLAGSQGSPANLTLEGATVGSLTVVDADPTNGSSAYYGHLDIYGQSAITGTTTIGGGRPLAPGFVDAYVHGSDGVLTLSGATLGGESTLAINGDQGSTAENNGTITIQGGVTVGYVAILTNLQGTGTISGGTSIPGGLASVLLGGDVGPGQTINLTQANLELKQPMSFAGTLAGFTSNSVSEMPPGLTLDNETAAGVSFAQSSSNAGDLSVLTQDPSTGAAGATLVFHVAGTYASDAFTFTNNAAAQSATITVA